MKLLEREEEDVLLLAQHVGLHESLGLIQQGLLVHEVATDHAVLRILPVPDERPDAVDHPFGFFRLALPVGQGAQSLEQLPFLLRRFLSPVLEAALAGARLEILDVGQDHRQKRRGAFAPTRPGDVDLADAAHAVVVEVGADRVARSRPPSTLASSSRKSVVVDVVQERQRPLGAGGSRRRRRGAPAPSPT